MTSHRCTLLVLASFLFTLSARAQPPAEPLPAGAKLRLGTARMRDSQSQWAGAMLAPDGKHLIAYTNAGFVSLDVTSGVPDGKLIKAPPGVFSRNEMSADGSRMASVIFSG